LRTRARENGDEEQLNLWAGQAHELARDLPARQLAVELAEDAAAALDRAAHQLNLRRKAM
jgi:nitronate monooxygenase